MQLGFAWRTAMMFPVCGPMGGMGMAPVGTMAPMSMMGMVPMGMANLAMANMGMANMAMANMGMANMGVANMCGMGGMAGIALGMGMSMAAMGMMSTADGEIGPNGELTEGKKYHGVVKRFSPDSTSCVFMVPGAKEDVFASDLDIPKELERQPLAGQPFAFKVVRGADGKLQAKQCHWKGVTSSDRDDRAEQSSQSRQRSRSRRRRRRSRSGGRGNDKRLAPIGGCDVMSAQSKMPDGSTEAMEPSRRRAATGASSESSSGCLVESLGTTVEGAEQPPRSTYLAAVGGTDIGKGGSTDAVSDAAFGSLGSNTGVDTGSHTSSHGANLGGSMGSAAAGKSGCRASAGARLQGHVKSWAGSSGGLLQCSSLASDAVFGFEDIPSILQRDEEARYFLLGTGTKVLFTLAYALDGSAEAKEVMPVPGAADYIIGKVKNYGANSGYGFIKPVEDSPFTHDLYFNHKDFDSKSGDCMRIKLEGALCKFNVRLTPDGKGQAKNIELVSWLDSPVEEDSAKPAGVMLHGIIQTYKTSSGYGFINCPKLGRDVWFPRRELPNELVGKDLLGTHVEFDLWVQGDEKPQARNVRMLKGNTTEALRLDLMSSRGKGQNMSVYDKVAIWQAHTGQLIAETSGGIGTGRDADRRESRDM